ncbi:MAG: methyltransferase domain-containing protein [Parcubacteria group bacterium]|jgi:ubiquinone/menaquinone biosynthesis C-methylase UbiE
MLKMENDNGDESQKNQTYAVEFIKPEAVIQEIGIADSSVVADFGCAGGYFSLPIAKKIGENGVVYALDILPQSLEMVAGYAKTMGLTNIITKRVNLEKEAGSTLKEASCDWVIMKNMLFQNKDKKIIIKEAIRILKQGGKILIIEWDDKDFSIGPEKSLRISKEALMETIQDVGMSILMEVPVSNFHYGLILVK